MRRTRTTATAVLLLLAVVAQAGSVAGVESGGAPYIVVFDERAVGQPAPAAAADVLASAGSEDRPARPAGRIDRRKVSEHVSRREAALRLKAKDVYADALGGFSADLTASQLQRLQADPDVAFVMRDEKTELPDVLSADEGGIAGIKTTYSSAAHTPAGVVRVGATRNAGASINGSDGRVDADVAILDTGVDGSHPDLNVVGGYNCTTSNRGAWGDQHGHGTHVAGTVAALDNGVGVVGVAPGARIWSVKVLNKDGTGYLSWLVCGINWVTAQLDSSAASGQLFEVANMSLRFSLPNADNRDCGVPARDAVHQAICRSTAAGVTYAAAAGNDTKNAKWYRPAAYQEVITVSAIVDYDGKPGGLANQADYCPFYASDPDDTFAKFSNFGKVIDLTAPGKCVMSTYPGKRYAWMSGTSMATPHVAGGVALYRVRYPAARPQQVRMALQYAGVLDWRTATDPDGFREKLLWIGSFGPPPDFAMSASSPAGWVGSITRVPISISRTAGHTEKISLRISGGPAGVSGSGTISGSSGYLTLYVSSSAPSGRHRLTVQASDGELIRTSKIYVNIDAQPPTAAFTTPAGGTQSIQSSTYATIAWNETDSGGSGVVGRSLQRQRGLIRTAGTCADVSWSNIGTAETAKKTYTQRLRSGYCFRWLLTVEDGAGNRTSAISGSMLIDASAPVAPTVTLSGSSQTYLGGASLPVARQQNGSTIWFRGGTAGSLELTVNGSDPQSGVASATLTAQSSTSGWGTLPRSASGNPATVSLTFYSGAVSTELGVRSVNNAGAAGSALALSLRRDSVAPASASWSSPAASAATSATSTKLSWSGGSDAGSGLAGSHWVRRQRATVNSAGTCTGVSFTADGPARLLANNSTETDLSAGYCYRWLLRTMDVVGNLSGKVFSGTVRVGGASAPESGLTAPSVTAPRVELRPAARVKPAGGVRLDVSWTASSTAGVSAHELRLSGDGGSTWSSVSLADSSSPRAIVILPSGSGYVVAARARDGGGNWSDWVASAPFSLDLNEAESSSVRYSGSWKTASLSKTLGGQVRHSSEKSATASYTFTGRQLAIVGITGPGRGKADIILNGSVVATVDLRSDTVVKRKVIYSRSWAKVTTRTIEVRLQGTYSRPRVDLDAFVVVR